MQDTLITIIAIVVAGILLFIFPILAVAERNNDISQSIAEKAVSDFVTEVSTSGSITTQSYSKLINTLASTGNTYDVKLEVKKLDENIGKKTQWTSKKVIGENEGYSIYSQQIADELNAKGVYNLRSGDTISAKVENNNKTFTQNIRSMFSPAGTDNSEIAAEDSRVVTANGTR